MKLLVCDSDVPIDLYSYNLYYLIPLERGNGYWVETLHFTRMVNQYLFIQNIKKDNPNLIYVYGGILNGGNSFCDIHQITSSCFNISDPYISSIVEKSNICRKLYGLKPIYYTWTEFIHDIESL